MLVIREKTTQQMIGSNLIESVGGREGRDRMWIGQLLVDYGCLGMTNLRHVDQYTAYTDGKIEEDLNHLVYMYDRNQNGRLRSVGGFACESLMEFHMGGKGNHQ